MTLPLTIAEFSERTTSNYQYRLMHMSDQLRIAEQRLSMKVEREIDQVYQSHQDSLAKQWVIVNELKNVVDPTQSIKHA